MDGDRFDALARALAASRSRRGVLGVLAGLAAGALGLNGGVAVAQCRPAGHRCNQPADCCSGSCVPYGPGPSGNTEHRWVCASGGPTTTTSTTSTTRAPTTTSSTTSATTSSTTTAAATTSTSTTTTGTTSTTTTSGCLPSGTSIRRCESGEQPQDCCSTDEIALACCTGTCGYGSGSFCGQQMLGWSACCQGGFDVPCTGAGFNPACCSGFCAVDPGNTTGVCLTGDVRLPSGKVCNQDEECRSCNCTNNVCR